MDDFKSLLYKGLDKTGVAIVFIAAWAWQAHTSDKRDDRQTDALKEVSRVMAEQTEVVRHQSVLLQQLTIKFNH